VKVVQVMVAWEKEVQEKVAWVKAVREMEVVG
jgi:hypothetical protein